MSKRVEVLLRVLTRDDRGRPRECVLFYDDDTEVKLEGGEHFVGAFIREDSLRAPLEGERISQLASSRTNIKAIMALGRKR